MIHYTLLPEEEALGLKREYRIRVFIVLSFFISCAIVCGIIFLFPSYIVSSIQENELVGKLALAQKNKEARGVDVVLKKLNESSTILKKIKDEDQSTNFSSIIKQIISNKPGTEIINSIQISIISEDKQLYYEAILQGRSLTRESLLAFKKSLESNPLFSKVEFPIPDLTKNKNISFAVKLRLNKINK